MNKPSFISIFLFCFCLILTINSNVFSQLSYNIDPTFNVGYGPNSLVEVILEQSDGKIVIAGNFTEFNGVVVNRIARLNADGTIDNTFSVGLGANNQILSGALQSDGKIILGGYFTSINGISLNGLVRLNSNGTIDNSFNVGTGVGTVDAILIQSDGKIIIGGTFNSYVGTATKQFARLNSDGTYDTSFNPSGSGINYGVQALAFQSDGKIIVSGYFGEYNGVATKRVIRVNTDGTLDNTFNLTALLMPINQAIAVQSDDKIIIGGTLSVLGPTKIFRINTDGTIDNSFSTLDLGGDFSSFYIKTDGKIIASGGFYYDHNGVYVSSLAQFSSSGVFESAFYPGSNNGVGIAFVANDGSVLIGGGSITYNGEILNYVARLVEVPALVKMGKSEKVTSKVFPNPITNELTIEISESADNSKMLVYDMIGKLKGEILLNGSLSQTIDVAYLKEGSYYYEIWLDTEKVGVGMLIKG